jgi:tetratricopeptide (TPR) repeat protein
VGFSVTDEEALRRRIEAYMETAEDYMNEGDRHRAYMEFEKAAAELEAAGERDQLDQLWAHASAGFIAAQAHFQAGHSYLHLASVEAAAGRHADARDSYLSAANAFAAARDKSQDTWVAITSAVEQAVELSVTLGDAAMAVDLLAKCAAIHERETGFTLDAINCLERAQKLLELTPNHPLASKIVRRLQALLDSTSR